ncbi:ABC-three component system protein [Chromobacterium subtsugae]|uniref:ABC-three component system protein n=1 Tax=Chromobacterium subtsugae TaxID=251747 RepID=UPI0006413715|nr:ABC-three component system protein [Chromobacterium subtsugae]
MSIVTQKNITAAGDVVAGNKNEYILPRPTQLELFSKAYKDEVSLNQCTSQILDELTHYRSSKSDIRDLATKLSEAGYDHIINEAEELKENVAKLIIKNQHYKSAQKIITYLLSDIESIFNSKIKPKLIPNQPHHELNDILRENVELVICEKLGENVLDIYNRQMKGMVYFLTGNCHLEWT